MDLERIMLVRQIEKHKYDRILLMWEINKANEQNQMEKNLLDSEKNNVGYQRG